MTDDRPRLHLWAAPDRAGLVAALAGPPMGACPPEWRERLALVCPPSALAERQALARHRVATATRPRLTIRDKAIHYGGGDTPTGRVAFLYPGEGSQRVGMLDSGRRHLPPVAAWLAALDRAYHLRGENSPTALIVPPTPTEPAARASRLARLFDIGHGAQLCTLANLALTQVLNDLGIHADCVVGHSNGEHAAVIAACMDLETQKDAICAWLAQASLAGRALGQPDPPQRMAAISAIGADQLETILATQPGRLFLAMDNCPRQQVVGGEAEAVAAIAAAIAAAGGVCGELPFNRAYHTPLFSGWAATLATQYQSLPIGPARLDIHSCLTTQPMGRDPATIRRLMAGQWTAPVRFQDTVAALYTAGVRIFIEVGADAKLTAFVEDTLRGRPHLAVACTTPQRDEVAQLPHLLAALHAHGLMVDPARLETLSGHRPSPANGRPCPSPASGRPRPSPAVTRQHRLVDDARAGLDRAATRMSGATAITSRRRFTLAAHPFLADHALGRAPARPLPVLSFTTSLAVAARAARPLLQAGGPMTLDGIEARSWLAVDGAGLDLDILVRRRGPAVTITLGGPTGAFTATARPGGVAPPPPTGPAPDAAPPRHWSPDRFYRDYAFHGPSFRGITRVDAIDGTGIAARLTVTAPAGLDRDGLEADPALLDCAGQLVALWLLDWHQLPATIGVFPFRASRVTLLTPPPPPGTPIRCQGEIRLEDGIRTRASFLFSGPDGTIAAIDGLEQRVMEVPAAVAAHVFGPPEHPAATRPDAATWGEALDLHGGIWARLLAHQQDGNGGRHG